MGNVLKSFTDPVKKIVGDVTGANDAAAATEASANVQAQATRDAATQAAAQAREAAAQTAAQGAQAMALSAARNAATQAAAEGSANQAGPDVNLASPTVDSAAGAARKRRATFGVGSSNAGVNI